MSQANQMIEDIIDRYKEELEKIGIRPRRIILCGPDTRGGFSNEGNINLIIISNDLSDIDICERLEVLTCTSQKISTRIAAIGYTEKEGKDSLTHLLKRDEKQ